MQTDRRHPLLERQKRWARGQDGGIDIERLLDLVEQAYKDYDRANAMADRATRLVSDELTELNEALRLERDGHLSVRQAAEAANTAKSQFLARMSHELRTPLNAILGFGELLQEELSDTGMGQVSADVARILSAGRHLLGLINEVLDLAKIEAGRMEVFEEPVDLDALLRETIETAAPLAAKNSNSLTLDCSEPLGRAMFDAVKLRQCLLNLISNACKFTSKGAVLLEAKRLLLDGQERLMLAVVDTGVGIPLERQAALFEPFVQAHDGREDGTGLGLTITRRLCELMGGSIVLASALGVGTRVTLRLPFRAVMAKVA